MIVTVIASPALQIFSNTVADLVGLAFTKVRGATMTESIVLQDTENIEASTTLELCGKVGKMLLSGTRRASVETVVQEAVRQALGDGSFDVKPNHCWPHGSAMDAASRLASLLPNDDAEVGCEFGSSRRGLATVRC